MSATGLDVFDTTVHKTNAWLKEEAEALGIPDRHAAYAALRATLHALRDRLTVEEVAQLGAQLPMLMRGFYYEGWNPTDKPVKARHRADFLDRVAQELRGNAAVNPEDAARASFRVLAGHVTDGEIQDVKQMLPTEIRDLWPDTTFHA
jgi:uncharacterized protein (DUF2267 family)